MLYGILSRYSRQEGPSTLSGRALLPGQTLLHTWQDLLSVVFPFVGGRNRKRPVLEPPSYFIGKPPCRLKQKF